MPSLRLASSFAVSAAVFGGLLGCQPEEDNRLFDERGVWAVEKYRLPGNETTDVSQQRKNRFLLRFSPEDDVVAAANCFVPGESDSITAALCDLSKSSAQWACRCFAYEYDEDVMVWQEFEPGDPVPAVGDPTVEDSGAHELTVEFFGDSTQTVTFTALPLDLFDSDGELAAHTFQIKADSVWTGVDVNEDGTPDLDACSQSCFPSEAEAADED